MGWDRWVTTRVGIEGNDKANEEAKVVADEAAVESRFMAGGGIRQWVNEQTNIGMRRTERDWRGQLDGEEKK